MDLTPCRFHLAETDAPCDEGQLQGFAFHHEATTRTTQTPLYIQRQRQ